MLTVLAWIVLGGVVGWLASVLRRGASVGVVGNVVIGVIGAVIAGVTFALLLPHTYGLVNGVGNGLAGLRVGSWWVAVFGAALLLFLVPAINKSRRGSRADR
jgi:uncharacterized membrane protein YeaQ/YmgE (transglycosylase-associated protein family)